MRDDDKTKETPKQNLMLSPKEYIEKYYEELD